MDIIDAAYTYHVEILHADASDWNHIHPAAWEISGTYADTFAYARQVAADHPASQVRVVEHLDGYPDHHIPVA